MSKEWKLVPVELTEAMREAYEANSIAPIGPISKYGYRAMLDAAPEAPRQEPVACMVRHRHIITEARIAADGQDHFSQWTDWYPNSLEYGKAVTDPGRNNPVCYEMAPLYDYPSEPDIEAAAKKLAACMDYPWEHMPEQGRASMREHAKAVIDAALGSKQ
ncbi:MAG: hypothetical protein KKC55_16435 [Gammaproteobacteria bacterium]|uniref:Uncharacterized protein n=1 Tax=viral metagenome TaxID=1070528 RepID=A0A6M3M693_9ZZZZ|nr:hypothetical protein [Gammaproteobacteria bacterium]